MGYYQYVRRRCRERPRFNCNSRRRPGHTPETGAAEYRMAMNLQFLRPCDRQEQSSAAPRSQDDAASRSPQPDPYHGAALGVECAWPTSHVSIFRASPQ